MKREAFFVTVFLILFQMGMACAGTEIQSVADLNHKGRKVGLSLGSAAEEAMQEEALPTRAVSRGHPSTCYVTSV